MGSQPDFSLPAEQASFSGFLFDMDGTIIDSTPAIIKHWTTIADELGIPPQVILETSHGRRSIDVLKTVAPERANWEYVIEMEGRLPVLYGEDATEVPGARSLLDSLSPKAGSSSSDDNNNKNLWAIVTSGTQPLVTGWLSRLSLAKPQHLITGESVQDGKPHPAGYLLGLAALGLQGRAQEVLVLEDSPAGIEAGKAAGCKVIGLVTSHTAEEVAAARPDWVVKDLASVRVIGCEEGGKVMLEISNGLRRLRDTQRV